MLIFGRVAQPVVTLSRKASVRLAVIIALLPLSLPLSAQTLSLPASRPSAAVAGPTDTTRPPSPSLEETEEFIADKIGEEGHILSTLTSQYSLKDGRTTTLRDKIDYTPYFEVDKINKCEFFNYSDANVSRVPIDIKNIVAINIRSLQDTNIELAREEAQKDQAISDPVILIPQSPQFFSITIKEKLKSAKPSYSYAIYYFKQHDTVLRVAKAFAHAIELCGGGQKEAF